ncbi:MAG: ATP-binding protein [Planctomycetaceae bacterium]|uniref:Serine-protein kinase RsbW n=1 Tax=Lacipirellula limnantheis TaxID=2528024 RepID=A0A517TVG0_9BACT|nr:ATP-binding protein [Lacipirellula limnantheis]MBL9165952.1 ATP-binding protein [Planctomycetaceae bacterium]QDT72361.1 Serine-protein kinase RsbW [Lacipirellula limnantheis]
MSATPPSDERSLQVALPSSLDAYHGFIQSIMEHLEELGWSGSNLFAIQMALEESISNAIRHGNKEDPSKQVVIECELSSVRFWIRVCDEGAGFDPKKVPDCCDPDRLEIPGGRGLALMQAFMSRMEYNDRGNCLTMEKSLSAASSGCSCD